jgi:hypothetical protein
MAQTRTIVAVDPATGARLTRRTARTYVAVVVIGDPAQGRAVAATWCGRPDLAEKALRKFSRDDARLAPVVEDSWTEPAAGAKAQAQVAPIVAAIAAAPNPVRLNATSEPTAAKPTAAKPAALSALESLAAGGPLDCATWQALGWPFEGFLAWAQDRDADRRLELMRETIRERGAAACLDLL